MDAINEAKIRATEKLFDIKVFFLLSAILLFADNYLIYRGYGSVFEISSEDIAVLTHKHKEVIAFVMAISFFFSAITPILQWIYGGVARPIQYKYFPDSFKNAHSRHHQTLTSFQWEAVTENSTAKYSKWKEESENQKSKELFGKVCFANVFLAIINSICGKVHGSSVSIAIYEWANALNPVSKLGAVVTVMMVGAYVVRRAITSHSGDDEVFRFDLFVKEFIRPTDPRDGKDT